MMSYSRIKNMSCSRGFTLVEVAIVLVVVSLLLGSILGPLSTQSNQKRVKETQALLQTVHDALLGFATIHGYLPCPASAASSGLDLRDDGSSDPSRDCNNEHGLVPSSTLGLNGQVDPNTGVVSDAWLQPIFYSLTNVNSWEYAKEIDTTADVLPFEICNNSTCAASDIITSEVVAVLYSRGKDNSTASPNQSENSDNDNRFVDADESESVGSEYDDQVLWLSPNILILQLVKSGRLNN